MIICCSKRAVYKNWLFGLFAAMALLPACDKMNGAEDYPKSGEQIEKVPLTKAEQKFVEAGNEFAWTLTARLWEKNGETGDLFLSPLSVQYALGMVLNGAEGAVADKLADVLGYKGTSAVNSFCRKLIEDLPRVDTTVTLSLANAVLVNDKYKLSGSFSNAMKEYYDAEVANMSFANPQPVVDRINNWCKEHTYGRIPHIMDASSVDPNAVSYLMNAIYFNGKWMLPFTINQTKKEEFKSVSGKTVKVDMMHNSFSSGSYGENDKCQMLSLPYGNGKYKMTLYLPKEGVSIKDVIASAGSVEYDGSRYEVILSLPKFESDYKVEMSELLFEMGVPSGTYNGMLDNGKYMDPVVISKVIHRANITVDETGSEAAAVTVIEMSVLGANLGSSIPAVEFKADHSFFYTITESTSGVILFCGVYDGD